MTQLRWSSSVRAHCVSAGVILREGVEYWSPGYPGATRSCELRLTVETVRETVGYAGADAPSSEHLATAIAEVGATAAYRSTLDLVYAAWDSFRADVFNHQPSWRRERATVKVITNYVPRPIIDAGELNADERAEFGYLDWPAIDRGAGSASFFRYKGQLHDLGEFSPDYGITKRSGLPDSLANWDGCRSDSFFSALVVRFVGDDSVVVGRLLS